MQEELLIEAIRLFFAYASFMGLIVYQMDVKSAFLYGIIEEEVYVCQPTGFEDPQFPDKVYKVEKALYGLHQAPRAWYETLSTYLLENGYRRGTIDKTLFIKKDIGDILLVQVYVDDIIFGSTKKSLCVKFEQMMHKRFQMSSMGELTFFLGLQVQQKEDGIFISQDKYVADILKKFDFTTVKAASTPIETNKALNKDEEAEDVDVHLYRSMIGSLMYLTASRPDIMFAVCACARDSPFDLEAFSDSDYAGASLDRKSTTGGCQFLGKRLISWQCKKQTIVANSTTEAEYVAAANCCGQVLWIQNQMLDYGFNFMNTKIHIDNESTICIVKNPVFHSKTKHIEIRHHFIRDSYEKKLVQVIKIHTDHNVADLLTKAFDVSRKAKRTTEISQSSRPIHLVADETVYKEWEDRMERAATTASSLEAEQDSDFCDKYNMVAYLQKSEGSEGFHQIIDFFTTSHISTLDNGDMEITATIDGKVKVVSEASIRRHLKLKDSVGISTLPTSEIFEQSCSNGGEGSAILVESHHTPISAPSTSQPPTSPPSMQITHVAEEVATMPYDSPLLRVYSLRSDEGSMTLNELTVLCTTLSKKKLEHKVKTSKARRRVRLVVSEDEYELEDPSKQGRKIAQIDEDKGITLFISPEEDYTAEPDISTANVPVSTAGAEVSTASPEVKTAAESLVYIRRSATKRKDKGKAIMKEAEPVQKKTKLQLEQERLGLEEALRLQEQLDEEERQRIARVHEEASTFNAEEWDNIQAQIEADEELAYMLKS
ncbi:putative ribonuclease H-like domain-containing protein [Tanacetum coccineum]